MIVVKKATLAQTKNHNKTLILKTIYSHGQISRADVARFTRLTRPTVSSTVAALMDEGLVAEVGQGPSEGGKPPILLSVVDDARHLIGIDLANSEFRGAIINLRGNIVYRLSLPVNDRKGQSALELVYELIDNLIAAAVRPLAGIGLGTPGLLNPDLGVVRQAVNLDWQNLPLRDLLAERYQLPVYIANDSQVAALGEYIFGHRQKLQNLVVIKVGRGVGSGIVIGGQLHFGDEFGAGEIGHVGVVSNGELCRCGNTGCLETVVSSRILINRAKTIMQQNPQSLLHRFAATPADVTTDVILQAFNAGDVELRQVIAEMGRYLGIAVANLVGILNIKNIVIGGSLARFGDTLLEAIRQEMHLRVQPTQASETLVEATHLDTDIVIFGAAALLLTSELALV